MNKSLNIKKQVLRLSFLSLFCFSILTVNSVNAECNAATDPCAPQKVIGEWTKALSFGFNQTKGNSQTVLGTMLGDLYKETKEDIWDIDLAYSYGQDKLRTGTDANGLPLDKTTRNDLRLGGVYKKLLSDRSYVGVDTRFLYDEVALIDYRVNLTPQYGYYVVKNADWAFDLNAGPGYLFEQVGGINNSYFAPKIGEGLSWVISCTSKIYQKMDVTFDINDSENYIINAELGVDTAISSLLGLTVLIRETYDNQPAAGREKGDLAIITGLKVNL